MASVTFSPQARRDQFDILRYLAGKAGPRVARELDNEIKRVAVSLRDFPRSGSPRPEFGENVRMKVIYPYLVFYEVSSEGDAVQILRILHGHRNLTPTLVHGR